MRKKHWTFGAMLALLLTGTSTGTAYAQDFVSRETALLNNIDLPSFFICVVGGVLLAIAFQTVLTLISVAAGVTAVGDLEKKGHQDKSYHDAHKNDGDSDSTPLGVKITSAMGIWTLITVSVSLFFASWLAVRLSLVDANFVGVSLGLIIWAAFFTLMVYLEVKMVSSLLGGLINMAFSSLRSGFSVVGGVLGKSQKSEMKEVAEYTIDHARQELAGMLDNRKLDKKIDKWVNTLKPDYSQMHRELASLINDIEVREEETLGREGVTREMFLNVTGSMPNLSKRDKQKMGEMFDQVKSAAKTEGSRGDKVIAAVDKLSPGSDEDTQEFRRKVEQYLRQANRDEIHPDRLKQDLEEILSHPSRSPQVIMNRLSQFDKNTLVAVMEQRPGISHQDAERYANYAEQAMNTIRSRFSGTTDKLKNMGSGTSGNSGNIRRESDRPQDGRQETTDLRNAEIGVVRTDQGHRVEAYAPAQESFLKGGQKKDTSAIEARIRKFFEDMPGQEWDYNRLKRDFVNMYHDPSAAPTILKQRLSQYDRDSMVALMENTGYVNRERAEKIADTAMEAKNEVIRRAHEIEEQAMAKVQQAKDFALHQAEATRKSAIAASWWLVGTAVVSALAAALGGMAAL